MVLVDTSVWVDHLRHGDSELTALLHKNQVLAQPFVLGELALGNLRQRVTVLSALLRLPVATVAADEEVLHLIELHTLHGIGIGYIDTHLLASTLLSAPCQFWTFDKRLRAAANALGIDHAVNH